MYIYSGNFREGVVGEPTDLKDQSGNELKVGDIVVISTYDEYGICYNHGLSVVVSDRFTSYVGGHHEEHEEYVFFIMGIKGVDVNNSDEWLVMRVKRAEDVIDGEHWKGYGFNYSEK